MLSKRISRYSFHVHLSDSWRWAFFHIFTGHLYILPQKKCLFWQFAHGVREGVQGRGLNIHMDARNWRQEASSIVLHLIFETWYLTESGPW